MRSSTLGTVALLALFALLEVGCDKPEKFTTTVKLARVQSFGSGADGPAAMDVELAYVDCPGQQEAIVRGDRAFAQCAKGFKADDKLPVEITFSYNPERSQYRSDVTKIGDCERKPDPKDDATHDMLHTCKDVIVHGLPMGVHCDKTRSAELVAKCPWFKRR